MPASPSQRSPSGAVPATYQCRRQGAIGMASVTVADNPLNTFNFARCPIPRGPFHRPGITRFTEAHREPRSGAVRRQERMTSRPHFFAKRLRLPQPSQRPAPAYRAPRPDAKPPHPFGFAAADLIAAGTDSASPLTAPPVRGGAPVVHDGAR